MTDREVEDEVNTNILFDVVASIVAYENDPLELEQAIVSVTSSRLQTRVVVVDNSPTDVLRSVVQASGGTYIHHGKNVGFGTAHNLAIRRYANCCKYFLVLNPDIAFGAGVLEQLYTYAENHSDTALLMPKIIFSDGRDQGLRKLLPTPFDLIVRRFLGPLGRLFFKRRVGRYLLESREMGHPVEIPFLSGCFMFVRSNALIDVDGFDERFFLYMEDLDLCRRLASRGKTIFYPNASVCHGYNKSSYREWEPWLHHMRSAIRYFNKWGWFFDPARSTRNRQALAHLPEVTRPRRSMEG